MNKGIPIPERATTILLTNGESVGIVPGSLNTSGVEWIATSAVTYREVLIAADHVSLVEYEVGAHPMTNPAQGETR